MWDLLNNPFTTFYWYRINFLLRQDQILRLFIEGIHENNLKDLTKHPTLTEEKNKIVLREDLAKF